MYMDETNLIIEILKQAELAEDHFQRGQSLSREEKDFVGAISHFKEVIQLCPEDWRAYDEIAFWLVDKLDDPQRGLEYAQKALDLVPKDFPVHYVAVLDTLGWCYYKLGRVGEAKEHFEKATRLQNYSDGFFVLHIYHLLCVYEEIGNSQSALELYNKIEALNPDNWINAEAKEKAKEIISRFKHLEYQKDRHKINELAKVWNVLSNLDERRCTSSEILKRVKLLPYKREKAKSKIKKLTLSFPLDPVVFHSLALVYYWEAENGEIYGDAFWQNFITYWVRLLYFDGFWEEWKKHREQLYFKNKIEAEGMDDLHRFILEEAIEKKVPASYKGFLLLEKKTAEKIRKLNEWGMEMGLNPIKLICGPLMLRELSLDDKFKKILVLGINKFPLNSDFNSLMLYLSPFGLATIFLEEKNIEQVFHAFDTVKSKEIPESFKEKYIDTIIEIADREANSEAKIHILQQAIQRIEDKALKLVLFDAYKKAAYEFAKADNWDRATNFLEQAFEIDPGNNDLEKELFICYLNSTTRKLDANKPEEAALIVEKAERLQRNEEDNEHLSDICFGCAIKFLEQDLIEKCEIALNKAKKYNPNNSQITQLFDALKPIKKFGREILEILSRARKAASSEDWYNAIEKYREALGSAENQRRSKEAVNEIKCDLAGVLNAKAVGEANDCIKRMDEGRIGLSEARRSLESSLKNLGEAKYLNPNDEKVKEMIGKNIDGIKSQLDALKDIPIYGNENIFKMLKELKDGKYKGNRPWDI